MILFWKKTDKSGKKKPPKPAVPRTAQQSIPMQRMFEDGTCRVKPNYYTRTIQYQDINYQLAQQEDKTAIFEEWCSFLNFFDSSIKFELSFVNMATDSTEFEKSIRIPFQKDGFDDVRAEYSRMLRQQLAKGNNGLTKTKFITFGVEGESMAQVKPRLDHIQNDLLNNFHRLGVQAKPLNGVQRLKLMHDMFNMDGASKFHFDWKDLVKSGLSVKDAIAPTAFAFKNSRTFQMGGIYCAASFLSITASDISDQLLKDFLDMDSSQIVTMHIQSVDQNKAIKTVKRTITELDRSKIEEQKKAIRAGYDIDIIPSDLATYGRDAKALLKELQSQNERMFLVTFLVLNTGRTEQELENNVFQASSIAQKGEQNVLKLIIARTLMAVSKPFRYLETLLTTECAGEEFTAKGKEILEEGWKAVERKVLADILDRKQELTALPNAAENECGILNAELKEGQTTPPKHFTEDLLLHAMETASANSMPEGVERQGIGTPATRAATIEKLVQKGFLERKGTKKTKVLLPTDKGKALITVMPEEIQSPEMTADWETKLLQIERGEMEPGEFMTEINTMITELVKNTEMKKEVGVLMKNKIIGVCPNCGKPVVEREKGWFCENRECRFVLWKDNAFFKRLGKRLDAHVADKLLRDGRVRLKDCKSSKGKTYNATVLLSTEADGRSKFSLEFEGGR